MRRLAFLASGLLLASCSYLPEIAPGSIDPGVTVTESREAVILLPATVLSTTGLMFYPGGLVDPHAYLPLLSGIAAAGIPVVLAKAPGNLAVFSPNAGLGLRSAVPGVSGWVVGGHSLGGAMAAWSAHDNPTEWRGVIFLAAWPPDSKSLADWPRPVLSISAELDGLATPADIDTARPLLPAPLTDLASLGTLYDMSAGGTVLYQIPGGVHAQFGSYGPQAGDGVPSITPEAQRTKTVDFVVEFFTQNGWL
jgi:pimeloyl-ACP methyl ester carboxylesterase